MFNINSDSIDFIKVKASDHKKNKQRILLEISKLQRKYVTEDFEGDYTSYISNTDWNFKEKNINWFEFSLSQKDKHKVLDKIYNKSKLDNVQITDAWFNQYYPNSGSDHPFHIHDNVNFSGIYYIELESKELRTVFLNPKNNKEIVANVSEGDILIFDGNIPHKSPRNFTNSVKTVLAFNFKTF